MMPMVTKLTRYAAYAGHSRRSAAARSLVSGGARRSSTRSVAAMANTPSLKVSRRLARMALSVIEAPSLPWPGVRDSARPRRLCRSLVDFEWAVDRREDRRLLGPRVGVLHDALRDRRRCASPRDGPDPHAVALASVAPHRRVCRLRRLRLQL